MNIDNKLDLLKQIREVEAPPFLFTRICQQIKNLDNVEAPGKWKWAFAVISVAILVLNVSILLKTLDSTEGKTTGVETVISSMNLASTNNIYNE